MSRFLTSCILFAWVLILSLMLCNSDGRYYDVSDCSSLSRCNRSFTGDWPQKPKLFKVSVNTDFLDRFVFILTWKAYLKNLQCNQILIRNVITHNICIILDFKNRNETGYLLIEHKVVIPVHNQDYVIEVRSLPQRNSEAVSQNVSLYDCSKWKSYDLKQTYDGIQIKVTFVKAPQRCNFTSYSVDLFDIENSRVSRKIVYEKVNATKLTAVFSQPLCKGKYFIRIQKDWNTQGCLTVGNTLAKCARSESEFETYIPRIPCYKDRILPKNVPEKVQKFHPPLIIGLVCVHLIIALGLLAVYIFKRQHSQPRKHGLVLFVDDYPAHAKAVLKLVDYLRECCFDIRLASDCFRHHEGHHQLIILSEALKSDFVLLVVSFAFQKRMEAWNKQQDYVEFFKERSSNMLTRWFLEKIGLWNKLYICKFDHVSNCYSWSEPCYSLPSHLTEMVKDLLGDGFKLSSLTCRRQKQALSQLDDAVKQAANYEHSNANWFHQKYFCPRAIVTEENGFSQHLSNW